MKTFLTNILLFSLPFLLLVFWFFWSDPDRQFAYNFLKNDCYGHGAWIYDRIYKNETPADIVFLGASGVIQAIYEEKIENILSEKYGEAHHLLNLGYCRPGRNLHFVILKDLLSQKNVETVVLSITETENRYSHPVFPNVAETEDLLNPVLLYNRDVFSDVFEAAATRLEFSRRKLFGQIPSEYQFDENAYGYGAGTRIAPEEELEDMKERRVKSKNHLSDFQVNFYNRYPHSYINKIAALCEAENVKLVFLYLKTYGIPDKEPRSLDFFEQFGEIWYTPEEILKNPNNWMDPDHLNIHGAGELAEWLAEKIAATQ